MIPRPSSKASHRPSLDGEKPAASSEPQKRPPRWGLRTLGFLLLALVALGTYGARGYHTISSTACTIIGLAGAAYCTYRGIRALVMLETRAFQRR